MRDTAAQGLTTDRPGDGAEILVRDRDRLLPRVPLVAGHGALVIMLAPRGLVCEACGGRRPLRQ